MRATLRAAATLLAAAVLAGASGAVAQGYQIRGDQVVVDRRSHWEHWQVPTHLVSLEADGSVRSRSFRTVYNVLDDLEVGRPVTIDKPQPRVINVDSTLRRNVLGETAVSSTGDPLYDYRYRPGVSRVGSNPELAAHVFDNDPTTFWEPDPGDPLDQWWIEIDLGRAVPLERLRLQFVDEELGDPFLRFILLLEARQLPLVQDERSLGFTTFVPFKGFNRDQRLFVIDAEHTSGLLPPAGEGLLEKRFTESIGDPATWTGKMLQVIRIQITETRGDRKEQITEEEWNELPPDERGHVEYYVRDVAGREEPVSSVEIYAALEPERQGRREYFRRELPRLAEVDAWGWGDNVAQGLIESGGSMTNTLGTAPVELTYDGDITTFYKHSYFRETLPTDRLVQTDLGGTIWLQEARVISTNSSATRGRGPTVRGYILRASSGVRDAEGRIKFQQISAAAHERNIDNGSFQYLGERLPAPSRVRFLEFLATSGNPVAASAGSEFTAPGVAEIMLYSEGPPAEVVLESDVIHMPSRVDLGAVRWEADTPPGTRLEIRTRTGDQLQRRIRYFDSGGGEKSEKDWNRLLSFLKGPSDTTFAPGAGWSAWSQRYEVPGERATSPPLRRYLQIQARLIAENGAEQPSLDRVSVDFHDPAVRELAAEVWPRDVRVGVPDTFEIYIHPTLVELPASLASPGFDELLVGSQPPLELQLLEVAVGAEAEFRQGQPHRLYDRRDGDRLLSADGDAVELARALGDSLHLRFSEALPVAPEELAPRSYFRALGEGDEVPTRTDGTMLNAGAHESLPEAEKGSVRYFDLGGSELDRGDWEALAPDERGPIRYFRIVGGIGDETPFDALGDTLSAADYRRLPARARGSVVGAGRLVRLRVAATVFLNGTELRVAARREGAPWQVGEPGDVTGLTPGRGLTLSARGAGGTVEQVSLSPNPFSPNGDGINDVLRVELSLFGIFAPRPLKLRIHRLDGSVVRVLEREAVGGRHVLEWDGLDGDGGLVPPGLYLAQVLAEPDADVSGTARTRVVHVVY